MPLDLEKIAKTMKKRDEDEAREKRNEVIGYMRAITEERIREKDEERRKAYWTTMWMRRYRTLTGN